MAPSGNTHAGVDVQEPKNRYVIGIDLGTTNTAVAYVDTQELFDGEVPPIHVFNTWQLVAEGEVARQATLPSFLYLASEQDQQAGHFTLPWDDHPGHAVGVLAREQGALIPGRWVASAKSWLCHGEVDRTAKILPWGIDSTDTMTDIKCSPVEAASRYLAHIREAWNYSFAAHQSAREAHRFERQEIVLTVPASFDAEARELTVQAAHDAHLTHLTLLEEPQAAFYAWMTSHYVSLSHTLNDNDLVLVCDVGGGTTDFSLIRVHIIDGTLQFERTAIGEHILLGGDNVDLALAYQLEAKLGNPPLTLRQRQALRRQSCAAKERLLNEPALERVGLSLLGSGSSVIGSALSTELTRDDVIDTLLEGFLPLTTRDDKPAHDRRVGLRELGLPYANEPAITKHLAQFLSQRSDPATPDPSSSMVQPNAILFNGGFFAPEVTRQRVVDTVSSWFRVHQKGWKPTVLNHAIDQMNAETAVAVGAAYYGHIRYAGGLRIGGGSARSYYIGIQTDTHPAENEIPAICVVPRGTEEGTQLELSHHLFEVIANRPVSFTLYSSITRHDAHGAVVRLEDSQIRRHAPLNTVLRYGKRSRQVEIAVQLTSHMTEVGTLELWCESQHTEHRWRLQFQLRGHQSPTATASTDSETTQTVVSETAMQSAIALVHTVFGKTAAPSGAATLQPEALLGKLEDTLGIGRDAWPIQTIRQLCDQLLQHADGRKKNRQYEARWLNLFGFCLRPGFSATLDEWRIEQARAIYLAGLVHPNHPDCQLQWLIVWRRIAGGLTSGQQNELYQRHLAVVGLSGKKRGKKANPQLEQEAWRLLASLERLPARQRVALGQELLKKIQQQPKHKTHLWSLARLGARIPFAGPLNGVIPADTAAAWIQTLLQLPDLTPDVAETIVQLGAQTDDPARDIKEHVRQETLAALSAAHIADAVLQRLRDYVPPAQRDAARMFGDSLPEGLRLVSSTDSLGTF